MILQFFILNKINLILILKQTVTALIILTRCRFLGFCDGCTTFILKIHNSTTKVSTLQTNFSAGVFFDGSNIQLISNCVRTLSRQRRNWNRPNITEQPAAGEFEPLIENESSLCKKSLHKIEHFALDKHPR